MGYLNLFVVIVYFISWFNVLKYKGSGTDFNLEIAIWLGSLYLSIGFLLFSVAKLYIKITRLKKNYILWCNVFLSVVISLFFEYIDEKFIDFDITDFVLGRFISTYLILLLIVCLIHLTINSKKQAKYVIRNAIKNVLQQTSSDKKFPKTTALVVQDGRFVKE